MKYTEEDLLNNEEVREQLIKRVDVLDKVRELLLLPGTEYATTEQVAKYYEVGLEAINTIINRHRDELLDNGYAKHSQNTFLYLLQNNHYVTRIIKKQGYKIIIFNNGKILRIANAGIRLFNKSAILYVGMLLSDSIIAQQVRKQLLLEYPEYYYELTKANRIRFKKYETEIKNYLEFSFGKENVKYQVSCGKYKLDFVLFDTIHIEIDEYGHRGYDQQKEFKRQNYIKTHTNYYTIRYNPQKQKPYELIIDIVNVLNNKKHKNVC